MPRRLFDDEDERQASLCTITVELNRRILDVAESMGIIGPVLVTLEMVDKALRKVEGE